MQGYYAPVAVFDDQLLYRYFDAAEMSRLRIAPLDGSGEPTEVEFPQGAAYLSEDGTILSRDGASGVVVYAVDGSDGFSLHEFGAEGPAGELMAVDQLVAHEVPSVTYHLGAVGGSYWFALVEEQEMYIGAQDYLGLYRVNLESGQVDQIDPGAPLSTRHNLHDLGAMGAAITGPGELFYVSPTGEVGPVPSALVEEYPGADRDLFDSVRAQGDDLLIAGYQMVELYSCDLDLLRQRIHLRPSLS